MGALLVPAPPGLIFVWPPTAPQAGSESSSAPCRPLSAALLASFGSGAPSRSASLPSPCTPPASTESRAAGHEGAAAHCTQPQPPLDPQSAAPGGQDAARSAATSSGGSTCSIRSSPGCPSLQSAASTKQDLLAPGATGTYVPPSGAAQPILPGAAAERGSGVPYTARAESAGARRGLQLLPRSGLAPCSAHDCPPLPFIDWEVELDHAADPLACFDDLL